MIIKLNDKYKKELLKFLQSEKELNLFIIGDMENYGFHEDFLEYWADFDSNNKMTALLMRFYDDFIISSKEEFDVLGFSEIIKKNNFRSLSGEKSVVEKFSKYLTIKEKRHMHFAKLDKANNLYDGELLKSVMPIKLEDTKKLWELHTHINGGEALCPLDRFQKKFIDQSGRGFHLRNDKNQILSSAETTAENSSSAMIVGVCTDPTYRGRGYAAAVISKLCLNLLSEEKTLCLFYDNPTAGKIYLRLGFEEIGFWSLWKG